MTPEMAASDWERVLYVGSADHLQHTPPHPVASEPRAFGAWTAGLERAAGALGAVEPAQGPGAGE